MRSARQLTDVVYQPGWPQIQRLVESARYGRSMADAPDNNGIGSQLLIALAELREITQTIAAADAVGVLDETEAEVFWRDWPEVRSWTEALWQRLGDDLAHPAQPVQDPELDEVGDGD
jgi:hypothetical protein